MSDANKDHEPQSPAEQNEQKKQPKSFARLLLDFAFYLALGVLLVKALGG